MLIVSKKIFQKFSTIIMKILPVTSNFYIYNNNLKENKVTNRLEYQNNQVQNENKNISFKGFGFNKTIDKICNYLQYRKAQRYSDELYKFITENNKQDEFLFRQADMDYLEGLQYGIPVFEGMSMKDLQYTSEFLHVIAVKRGCKHMCGHCYADAKPSKREMSFEDFKSITDGFKTIRERLHGLDIYGNAIPISKDSPTYSITELFFDADCMEILLKDKNGKEHDYTELSKILYESLGRKTVFDTSGWDLNNKKYQERAEKYAQYFSKPENIENIDQFNVSFNVFNASYIASRKALESGDFDKAKRLKERFLNNMANTLFTFSPVAESEKFNILIRAFKPSVKNSNYYNLKDLTILIRELINKLNRLYIEDLNGEQKLIKSEADYNKYMRIYVDKFSKNIDTSLNSSGRMKKFMQEHNIKNAGLQNHDAITPEIIEKLQPSARLSPVIHHKLIDADGKVYFMDYARIIPTEIQLNIPGKNEPSPKLANLIENFVITKENINL